MNYFILCFAVFCATYLLNIFYITVLYHRGLTHSAVKLSPWARSFLVRTGNWVTGLDPKAWACMHRLHHLHSDTKKDPHSPWNVGVLGLFKGQLDAYKRVLVGLQLGREPYASVVKDLDFPINWLNYQRIWWLPYAVHAVVALLLAVSFQAWLLGAAYWFGMMSHPIQGWMVNALAHKYGYQNYNLGDQSRNNTMVAWLVFGEGYQNNHHKFPSAPKFSIKWFEVDAGYLLCKIARVFGMLDWKQTPVPSPGPSKIDILPESWLFTEESGMRSIKIKKT